jgi:hypothetical protein
LLIEVVEIAEAATEEEVLADGVIASLDPGLRLGPVGLACLRQVAIVAGQTQQRSVVDDVASLRTPAAEDASHAVVEKGSGTPPKGLQRRGLPFS